MRNAEQRSLWTLVNSKAMIVLGPLFIALQLVSCNQPHFDGTSLINVALEVVARDCNTQGVCEEDIYVYEDIPDIDVSTLHMLFPCESENNVRNTSYTMDWLNRATIERVSGPVPMSIRVGATKKPVNWIAHGVGSHTCVYEVFQPLLIDSVSYVLCTVHLNDDASILSSQHYIIPIGDGRVVTEKVCRSKLFNPIER